MRWSLVVVLVCWVAPRSTALACAEPSAAGLFARLSPAEREELTLDGEGVQAPQLVRVELDGRSPPEAVLAIDVLLGDLHDGPARSLVWLLGCRDGAWESLGSVRLGIDDSWDGTLDDRPGVRVLREERVPGVDRAFLRIEHVDVRGGHDPRFVRRRLLLVSLVDGGAVVALDCLVRVITTEGPMREDGPTTLRYVVYGGDGTIRFRLVEVSPAGRRRQLCRTVLRFDGERFTARDCYEPFDAP